jgi:pSer/pThr/pTyr-binding forkhead associated (FHA) protein
MPEASVSSHHCEILLKGNDVIVRDLGSTNGTFVNGEKVTTEAPLKPGQILRLGQLEMRLESGQASAASGKKALDQTMVLPQGVKMNELEGGGTKSVVMDKNSPFAKKSNKANKVFIIIGVILGVVIIGLILLTATKLHSGGGQ